jgi:aerobic carbon-monoxide dehydrogenase small subunit
MTETMSPDAEALLEITLRVNGVVYTARAPARRLLSDFLRHELRLTGTHVGCEHGVCGACTVLADGSPIRSCLMFALTAQDYAITTVEGLAQPVERVEGTRDSDGMDDPDDPDGTGNSGGMGLRADHGTVDNGTADKGAGTGRFTMSPVQQAFIECHGLQCGFCTPGFLTAVTAYLLENPDPTETEAREAISGNLCRCTGYQNVVRSVLRAAEIARERGTGR